MCGGGDAGRGGGGGGGQEGQCACPVRLPQPGITLANSVRLELVLSGIGCRVTRKPQRLVTI